MERVAGIEPALSAWEAVPSGPVTWPDLRGGVSASDRERPLVTGVNGPLMARRSQEADPRTRGPGSVLPLPCRGLSARPVICSITGPAPIYVSVAGHEAP